MAQLSDPSFRGTLLNQLSSVIYLRQMNSSSTHSLISSDVFLRMSTVIYLTKSHYLIGTLNDEIDIFKSAGLVNYWDSKVFDKHNLVVKERQMPKVINMQHLLGCFQTWMCGMAFGVLVFVAEIVRKFNIFNH